MLGTLYSRMKLILESGDGRSDKWRQHVVESEQYFRHHTVCSIDVARRREKCL
jgi:hypothetical protein